MPINRLPSAMESSLAGMARETERMDRAAARVAQGTDTLTEDVADVTKAARHHEANAAVFKAASDMMKTTIDLLL